MPSVHSTSPMGHGTWPTPDRARGTAHLTLRHFEATTEATAVGLGSLAVTQDDVHELWLIPKDDEVEDYCHISNDSWPVFCVKCPCQRSSTSQP